MLVLASDPALRARIEVALGARASAPLIVTADLAGVAALRAGNSAARLIVVAISRAEVAQALDAGADVALAGELRPAELAARLRSLGRRDESRRRLGALVVDVAARRVTLAGVALQLPPREYALLCALASEPGRVFTKSELRCACGERNDRSPGGRTLERTAARLRGRLGRHAAMLVTVWGVGYRLDPDV